MTPVELVGALKSFIQDATKDLLLEVKKTEKRDKSGLEEYKETTKNIKEEKSAEYRPVAVYAGKLPGKKSEYEYVPYALIRLLTGADEQKVGEQQDSSCVVRIIFVIYASDPENGYIDMLNLITDIRTKLLKVRELANCFRLTLPFEYAIYEDETTGNYTIGDMVMTWEMPGIHQEVPQEWLQ